MSQAGKVAERIVTAIGVPEFGQPRVVADPQPGASALRELAWCRLPAALTARLCCRAADLLELLQHEDFGASAPRGDGRRPTSSTTADHDDVCLFVPRHFVWRDKDHAPTRVLDHGITGISCTKSRSKRDT